MWLLPSARFAVVAAAAMVLAAPHSEISLTNAATQAIGATLLAHKVIASRVVSATCVPPTAALPAVGRTVRVRDITVAGARPSPSRDHVAHTAIHAARARARVRAPALRRVPLY